MYTCIVNYKSSSGTAKASNLSSSQEPSKCLFLRLYTILSDYYLFFNKIVILGNIHVKDRNIKVETLKKHTFIWHELWWSGHPGRPGCWLLVSNTRSLFTYHMLPLDHFIFAFGIKQLFSVSDQPKVHLSLPAHMTHLKLAIALVCSSSLCLLPAVRFLKMTRKISILLNIVNQYKIPN